MVELHQTEVDGVRCFWVETGRPTLAALLMFRQGMADEPLTESGWLHMLEHLSLHGRGGGALHVNGSVSLLHTTFDVHGPVDGVVDHLAGVTAWLQNPVFHEFDRERGVLRAEAAMRGGTGARAFGWRYGARGPGVLSHEEPGMGRATPERLAQRAWQVFTTGNAALVLDGPPPAGLRLTLPEGGLLKPGPAVACEDTLPAAYVEDGGLVLSGVVTRSATATIAQEILQRALRERLRDHEGAAYAPWATYEPVDGEHAVLLGGSDVLPDLLPTLADSILDLVQRLREHPVPDDWLRETLEAREQAMHDPYFATSLAARAAHYHLMGLPAQTHQEVLEELRATTNDGVRETLTELCDTLLLGVPGKTTWRDQLPMITYPETAPRQEGKGFRSVDWPASVEHLAVGPDRLELSVGTTARVVELDRAAGLFVFEDGGRYVIGDDGWGLHVVPSAWRHGPDAVRALDAAVPGHLHLPHPARTDPPRYTALSSTQRWWRGARRLARTDSALWLWLALLLLVAAAGIVAGRALIVLGAGAGAVATVREIRASRRVRSAPPQVSD